MSAREIRERAREALRGKWSVAVIAALLYSGLSIISSLAEIVGTTLMNQDGGTGVGGLFLLVSNIASLLFFVVSGALKLGWSKFSLDLADGGDPAGTETLSCTDRIWDGFCLKFWSTLAIIFLSLLFVIPGVIAVLNYSMASFIMVEHPELTARETLKESTRLMAGNKMRFLGFLGGFIGWAILSCLTMGVGFIFLFPYYEEAKAVFYREISDGVVPLEARRKKEPENNYGLED